MFVGYSLTCLLVQLYWLCFPDLLCPKVFILPSCVKLFLVEQNCKLVDDMSFTLSGVRCFCIPITTRALLCNDVMVLANCLIFLGVAFKIRWAVICLKLIIPYY